MRRPLSTFRRDRQGAAAIEFALVFPILFLLHVGAAEALGAYVAQRNAAHIASTLADVTALERNITTADLNDLMSVGPTMIYPLPAANLQMRISSMSASSGGSVSQDWTIHQGYVEPGSPSTPSGYLNANESVIVTDVVYDYEPVFKLFMPDTIRFVRHAYARPRLSNKVDKLP